MIGFKVFFLKCFYFVIVFNYLLLHIFFVTLLLSFMSAASPEKILPVLPAMETKYWTRCWQLVVLPLPDLPSSTMD